MGQINGLLSSSKRRYLLSRLWVQKLACVGEPIRPFLREKTTSSSVEYLIKSFIWLMSLIAGETKQQDTTILVRVHWLSNIMEGQRRNFCVQKVPSMWRNTFYDNMVLQEQNHTVRLLLIPCNLFTGIYVLTGFSFLLPIIEIGVISSTVDLSLVLLSLLLVCSEVL